jgi:hypothetical protein
MRVARWAIAVVGGLLVLLAIVAGTGSRTATLRQLVIQTLSERLDAEVELQTFSVDTFPIVHVTGTGLVLRHKGRRDVPPLVSIGTFSLNGGLMGLMARPRKFRTVTLTGLRINIPPGGLKRGSDENVARRGPSGGRAAILVARLIADDVVLTLIPRRAGKQPKVFAVHRLTMDSLGQGKSMPFDATITNPLPRGLIKAKGTFGPWGKDDPGSTPVSGRYTFDDADLSTVKGIGGILDSTGEFRGQLDRIAVTGETETPDFRLNVSGNPVSLRTKFDALVDGTDGDTYLNSVSATILRTDLTAKGAIVGAEGVKGRTVKVHVKIAGGHIEDLLRLAVKGPRPVMTGRLGLHADLNLPAGRQDVIDRLELAGEFDVDAARFTNQEVQAKISEMSERARGLNPEEHSQSVMSDLRAKFRLARGVLSVNDVTFGIPGATVNVAGTYGLESEALEFDGTVRMQATISQAAGGGVKSVLLKVVDPVFRKDGAGAVLPIRVRGSRNEPKFGLDVKRVIGKKPR